MTRFAMKMLTATVLAGTSVSASAVTPVVTDNVVLYWQQVLQSTPGGPPPQVARDLAITNIAIHDAINATVGGTNKSYTGAVANPGGDTRTAASVAAHNVLVALDPAHATTYDNALTASLALVPDSAAKTAGVTTGAAFATAAIAMRASDGMGGNVLSTPTGQVGAYAPTAPTNVPGAVSQQLATATPFLMMSDSQFRSAPPPAIGSAEYAAAYASVQAIGSATGSTRTADQTAAAIFWDSLHGNDGWVQAAIDQSLPRTWTDLQYAAMFATLSAGVADAIIASWDDKVTYDLWRPITAIQSGATDGNAATVGDSAWIPLLVTPPFQSYVSAHSIVNMTAATILDGYLGGSNSFCLTSGGTTRCWDGFNAAALESSQSREWGGIHFNFDDSAGVAAGQGLGRFALATNAFGSPVPEPSTWTMLLAGFAMVGFVLRRRQAQGTLVAG